MSCIDAILEEQASYEDSPVQSVLEMEESIILPPTVIRIEDAFERA
jgi:hypothetical protein